MISLRVEWTIDHFSKGKSALPGIPLRAQLDHTGVISPDISGVYSRSWGFIWARSPPQGSCPGRNMCQQSPSPLAHQNPRPSTDEVLAHTSSHQALTRPAQFPLRDVVRHLPHFTTMPPRSSAGSAYSTKLGTDKYGRKIRCCAFCKKTSDLPSPLNTASISTHAKPPPRTAPPPTTPTHIGICVYQTHFGIAWHTRNGHVAQY